MPLVSYAARLAGLADADPDHPAVTDEWRTVTRRQLDSAAEATARQFVADGVDAGDTVTIALPNSVEFIVATIACWKIGAVPQPVSSRLPRAELDAIIELAEPALVLMPGWTAPEATDAAHPPPARLPDAAPPERLPDAVSSPWKAMTSGGSTGRPKLILASAPGLTDPDAMAQFLIPSDGCLVMPGPLYHNAPFVWTTSGLMAGAHIVLGGRFDAATTMGLLAEHRADVVYLVPTMMLRIWRLPEDERLSYDLSNLKAVWHLAAPCPPWLKQCWIDWLGPERIWELYAGTEAQAATIITGQEWLAHKGSVGKVASGEIRIVDADGSDLPAGEVGEVFMRPPDPAKPTYRYVGAEARTMGDGWESLGDMGWVDADGYLYLTDRRTDMVLVGGSNVYPAEVEAALEEHPAVRSCAVVGLADEELGSRLHAVVQVEGDVDAAELESHLRQRLVSYKVPRSYEFVGEPVRDDAGKVRRSALRDARG